MSSLYRRVVLKLAGIGVVQKRFQKYGSRLGVRRFVAGDSLEEAVTRVKSMNSQGLEVTLDYLGESILDPRLADEAADQMVRVLETIGNQRLNAHLSVKLTQLGFQADPLLCLKHMERITAAAQYYNTFVRIDMEDSTLTDSTLKLFRSLVERFGPGHIGVVIQAYLGLAERFFNRNSWLGDCEIAA